MKKLIVSALFSTIGFLGYGQNKIDSMANRILGNPVPIFEYGSPLTSCETNFKNLFKNWTPANVTNAHEYELLDYSFVETLNDTARYNYYRNYFSSGEVFGSSIATHDSQNWKLKKRKGKHYFEKTEASELFVHPSYPYNYLFDQRGCSEEAKEVLSEDFTKQAKELLMRELNIDTMKLVYTSGDIYKTNKEKFNSDGFGIVNTVEKQHITYDIASKDSISPKLFDNLVLGKDIHKELTVQEKRALTLEEISMFRISAQYAFNKDVHFGDKVYAVRFRYQSTTYKDYFICNPQTKKVVMEYFFKNITMRTTK